MEDEYYAYPEHVHIPLLDSREDAMSSSSDSDRSQDVSRMNLSGKTISRKWIETYDADDLDQGLCDLISTIIETITVKKAQPTIYPPSFHEELQRKNKDIIYSIKKLNYEHVFAIGGNSLVSTLNITNNLISVPKGVRCDVCIFSSNNPVLLLTFVEDEKNIAKKERCNELLTRELTDILRTYMDETISVARGVVVKGSDLKSKIKTIQGDVKGSFFGSMDKTLSFEDLTLQSAITAILIGISRAPSYQFIENRPGVIWTLSAEEVEKVLEHIDGGEGSSYTSTLEDPGLILEIASRRSRRRRVRLDLTKQQYSKINISGLRRWYPNLEVTCDAESKGVTIHGKVIRVRKGTTVDTEASNSSDRSKRTIKRRNTERKNQELDLGIRVSLAEGLHGQRTENIVNWMKDLRIRFYDFRLINCLIAYVFFSIYNQTKDPRYHCFMKCLLLLYLIIVVGKEYLHRSTHKKGMLLFGLVCSNVGDAFVWKTDYFEQGLTFLSLAHISYAFVFGLKPIRFRRLLIPLMLTFILFFYFTSKMQGILLCVLLLYLIGFNITIWRVIATLHCLCCLELVGAISFLATNAFILVNIPETQSAFPNKITIMLYHTAQLGMVTSILKSFRDEITSQDSNICMKTFFRVVMLYVSCSALLTVVIKNSTRVPDPNVIVIISSVFIGLMYLIKPQVPSKKKSV